MVARHLACFSGWPKIWLARQKKIAFFWTKCHNFCSHFFRPELKNFRKKISKKHCFLNTPTRYWEVRLTNQVFCLFFSEISRRFLKKNKEKRCEIPAKKSSFFWAGTWPPAAVQKEPPSQDFSAAGPTGWAGSGWGGAGFGFGVLVLGFWKNQGKKPTLKKQAKKPRQPKNPKKNPRSRHREALSEHPKPLKKQKKIGFWGGSLPPPKTLFFSRAAWRPRELSLLLPGGCW